MEPQLHQKFIPRCASGCHEEASRLFVDMTELVMETNTIVCDRSIITWLVDKNFWVRRKTSRYICKGCIAFVKLKCKEDPAIGNKMPKSARDVSLQSTSQFAVKGETESITDDNFNVLLRSLRSKSLSTEQLRQLATALGEAARPEFELAAKQVLPDEKSEVLLQSTYTSEWNNHSCNLYRAFLHGVVNEASILSRKVDHIHRMFQKSLECILRGINMRFVSPLAIRENVVLHSYTGSRAACDIFGHSQASGSYRYALDIIKSLQMNKPEVPTGDVYVGFDNQQKIGKQWGVSLGGAQKTSTVTSLVVFAAQKNNNFQTTVQVPRMINLPTTDAELITSCRSKFVELNKLHNEFRVKFINARLEQVQKEFIHQNGSLENPDVMNLIEVNTYELGTDYSIVDSKPIIVTVTNLENMLVNPNSYKTIAEVLDHIRKLCFHSDPIRKWIVLHCDGLPYTIVSNLIKDTYCCPVCDLSGKYEIVHSHKCSTAEENKPQRKYENIILRPGAGHFEINMVRSIFKVYFGIFIEPLAKILGFKTENSLNYCKSAADHHKSWEILQILRLALADELVHLFLKHADASIPKDAASFGKWSQEVQHRNFRMAFDFVFTSLHSLFLFRAGIRQANDSVAQAGLHKAASIFYGFNHPRYQKIYSRDFIFQLLLSKTGLHVSDANGFVLRNSLIVEGSNMGQGVDMLVEEQNKEQKHWLISSGVPTDKQWISSSASLSYLQNLKKVVVKDVGIYIQESEKRKKNFFKEYLQARKYFRKFLETSPSDTLTSFTVPSQPLDSRFSSCSKVCKENQEKYILSILTGTEQSLQKININPLSSMTRLDKLKLINSSISQLLDSELQQYYTDKLQDRDENKLEELYDEILDDIVDI